MVGPNHNGSKLSERSRRNAAESYVRQQAMKTCSRRPEKVEVGLEGPRGLCCAMAAIWYVTLMKNSNTSSVGKHSKCNYSRGRFPLLPIQFVLIMLSC